MNIAIACLSAVYVAKAIRIESVMEDADMQTPLKGSFMAETSINNPVQGTITDAEQDILAETQEAIKAPLQGTILADMDIQKPIEGSFLAETSIITPLQGSVLAEVGSTWFNRTKKSEKKQERTTQNVGSTKAECQKIAKQGTDACINGTNTAIKAAKKDKVLINSATKAGKECQTAVQKAYKQCKAQARGSTITLGLAIIAFSAAAII